jgi:stearoyl-CoA desaturase (delta-9 desaturase)
MSQAQASPPPLAPSVGEVEPVAHETRDRLITGFITVVPFVALGVVGWQVWNDLLRWSDVAVFVILYLLTGLGITVGFHRHLTHRAFKTSKGLRATLAILGSAAIEGPVTAWVADHRKHHAFSDKEGDPHSPHVGHEGGWRGALSGLFHAHLGWLFIHTHRGAKERYAPDLLKDPLIRFVDRTFVLWAVGGLVLAFALGWLIGGSVGAGLTGLLWGGAVRMLVVHHVTYSINSL